MSKQVFLVVSSNGDGSSSTIWVTDQKAIDKMEELADEGDAQYASGDGFDYLTLNFPEGFNVDGWLRENHISLTTFEDVDREAY